MKNIKTIFFILISVLFLAGIVHAANPVSINPGSPTDSDSLTCIINGVNPNDFSNYLFQWYVNGLQDKAVGNTWIYSSARTFPGQEITCTVFTHNGIWVGTSPIVKIAQDQNNNNNNNQFAPIIKIILPQNGATLLTNSNIKFQATASDKDGNFLTTTWFFGDGSTDNKNTLITNHSFAKGFYTVTVKTTDGMFVASDSITITVDDVNNNLQPPIARIVADKIDILQGTQVNFDGTQSFDPDGQIVDYSWDFGDGNPAVHGANLKTTNHIYNNIGQVSAKLTVTDNDGLQSSQIATINVKQNNGNNQPPLAVITLNNKKLVPNKPFIIDGSKSFDPDGQIVDYSWDFGDGSPVVHGANIKYTYNRQGIFTISLTVTDNNGASSTAIVQVNVNPNNQLDNTPPVAFLNSPPFAAAGFPVSVDAIGSFDPDGQIVDYSWDFGDGSPVVHGINVNHVYTELGVHNITLKVIDNQGAVTVITKQIQVIMYNRDGNEINKQRAGPQGNDNYRDFRVSSIMPLNYKPSYSKGETVPLLFKVINEGTNEETADLRIDIPEFNYHYVIRNIDASPNQVMWLTINIPIPTNAVSGNHIARMQFVADANSESVYDTQAGFWSFFVA